MPQLQWALRAPRAVLACLFVFDGRIHASYEVGENRGNRGVCFDGYEGVVVAVRTVPSSFLVRVIYAKCGG